MMKKKPALKECLKRQAEYRRKGKSSDWLRSYARGFHHPNFTKDTTK